MKSFTVFVFIVNALATLSIYSEVSAGVISTPCEDDSDCISHEACHNKKCIEVCQLQNGLIVDAKCGVNAFCFLTGPHEATCRCYADHSGDPFTRCNEGMKGDVDDVWKNYPAPSKNKFDVNYVR